MSYFPNSFHQIITRKTVSFSLASLSLSLYDALYTWIKQSLATTWDLHHLHHSNCFRFQVLHSNSDLSWTHFVPVSSYEKKVFKNGLVKICGIQPIKNLKRHSLLKQSISLLFFKAVLHKSYLVHSCFFIYFNALKANVAETNGSRFSRMEQVKFMEDSL